MKCIQLIKAIIIMIYIAGGFDLSLHPNTQQNVKLVSVQISIFSYHYFGCVSVYFKTRNFARVARLDKSFSFS